MSARPDLRMTPHRVLVLLVMLEDPARRWHGYEIMKRLTLLPGTVYPILRTLTTAGWLHASDEPRFLARGRPQRRYYQLTEDGLQVARERMSRVTPDAYVLDLATAAGLLLAPVTPTPPP